MSRRTPPPLKAVARRRVRTWIDPHDRTVNTSAPAFETAVHPLTRNMNFGYSFTKLEYSIALTLASQPKPVRGHSSQVFLDNRFAAGEHQSRIAFSIDWPRIALLEGFLTDEECAGLIEIAGARLARSTVYQQEDGMKGEYLGRTSQSAKIERAENDLVARVENRICALTGLAPEFGERMEMVHYGKAEEFVPHCDWFPHDTAAGKKQLELHGQRTATVILYVSDVDAGGSTVFPRLGIAIRPKRGNALYFWNLDRNGIPEPLTIHAGAPVERGEKTIVNKWFREHPWTESGLS